MLISPDIYFKTVFEWLSLVLRDSLFHFLLVICDFFNIAILQGSVATHLGCGGVLKICYKFPTECNSERIVKIS